MYNETTLATPEYFGCELMRQLFVATPEYFGCELMRQLFVATPEYFGCKLMRQLTELFVATLHVELLIFMLDLHTYEKICGSCL